MEEDILLSKFMEINERSKAYVQLMNQYPSMVENIYRLYDDVIALKKSQLDDFKLSVAKSKLETRNLNVDVSTNVKLNDELRKINKATSLLRDACLEFSAYKRT